MATQPSYTPTNSPARWIKKKRGDGVLGRYAAPSRFRSRTIRHRCVQGKRMQRPIHNTMQPDFFLLPLLLVRSAARVAYWNTSRTPSPVRAEHSRYCLAPIFWATAMPCASRGQNHVLARVLLSRTSSGVTGLWFVFLSSSITLGSRRRSFLQATSIIGRPGQKCITSEIHCITALAGDAIDSGTSHAPSPERCPASQGNQWRSRSK